MCMISLRVIKPQWNLRQTINIKSKQNAVNWNSQWIFHFWETSHELQNVATILCVFECHGECMDVSDTTCTSLIDFRVLRHCVGYSVRRCKYQCQFLCFHHSTRTLSRLWVNKDSSSARKVFSNIQNVNVKIWCKHVFMILTKWSTEKL